MTGISRQAVYSIENNQYLPATPVALRLSRSLGVRVEEIFNLLSVGEVLEADLIESAPAAEKTRVKVARVGNRLVARPVSTLGDVLNFTVAADGLVVGPLNRPRNKHPKRVDVELLRDRRMIEGAIVMAGCDPAIYLAGEHLRGRDLSVSIFEWPMGSVAALESLKRGEVHVAGLHIVDPRTENPICPICVNI